MAKKPTAKAKAKKVAKPARAAKIGKGMTLGDVLAKHPETAETMLRHGLHCIGCHVATFETIEQGALAHGMDPKEIDEMVAEMNAVAKEKKGRQ